jgi:hypothetical protein
MMEPAKIIKPTFYVIILPEGQSLVGNMKFNIFGSVFTYFVCLKKIKTVDVRLCYMCMRYQVYALCTIKKRTGSIFSRPWHRRKSSTISLILLVLLLYKCPTQMLKVSGVCSNISKPMAIRLLV